MNEIVISEADHLNWLNEVKKDKAYHKLPKLPVKRSSYTFGRVIEKLCGIMGDITALTPIIGLIANNALVQYLVRHKTKGLMAKISPQANRRLTEFEKRIEEVAQKMGIRPKKLTAHVDFVTRSFSTVGICRNAAIYIPAEYLVKEEDLPNHLKLINLHRAKITENEWISVFEDWLSKQFIPQALYNSCQFNIDLRREELRGWLRLFMDQTNYEKDVEWTLGHELGHIALNHANKKIAIDLICSLLWIPTFGLSLIFKNKIKNIFSRQFEKEADLFSAKWLGNQGGILTFQRHLLLGYNLATKYPDYFTAAGEIKKGESHPGSLKRIAYLKSFRPLT